MHVDRRDVIRSWSALAMTVVGVVGGVLSLAVGAQLFGAVCLLVVGLCGVGLLVGARRENALHFTAR